MKAVELMLISDFWINTIPAIAIKSEKKTFLEIVLYIKKVNATVKTGPVFPNNVAFAIEVFRTPQKKHAKCNPKKNPAIATRLNFFLFKGFGFLKKLKLQSKALAINILQKAIVRAGTEGRTLTINEVELTEIRARINIKYKRRYTLRRKFA